MMASFLLHCLYGLFIIAVAASWMETCCFLLRLYGRHVHCHCVIDKHLVFFPCLLYGHVVFAISVCWCGLCLGRLVKDAFRFLCLVVVDSVWLLLVGVLSHPVSLVIVVFSSTVTFPCSLLICSFKVCKMYQIWQLELLFVRLVKHISKYMLCSIAHNALAMMLRL